MAVCDVCGNNYDKAFQVFRGEETYTFDSMECAVQLIAPRCANCECRILGHGVESNGIFFCCAHCSRQAGELGVSDRAA